jgi:DNA-binding Lrp family transcriptional regulator
MDEIDNKLLTEMTKGIPLTGEPFSEIGQQLGITQQEVINRLVRLKQEGVIRRFGASIKPNSIGYSANALVAWKAPEKRISDIGEYLSKIPEISHCYERKTVLGRWDFNLYTVIHAQERENIHRIVNQLSFELNMKEYKILFSERDLKRTKLTP